MSVFICHLRLGEFQRSSATGRCDALHVDPPTSRDYLREGASSRYGSPCYRRPIASFWELSHARLEPSTRFPFIPQGCPIQVTGPALACLSLLDSYRHGSHLQIAASRHVDTSD